MDQKTVLYIEDNLPNRRIVRKILQSRGYSLIEAEDGISGLAMVQELKPPLVLLDIGLPGMDGLEVVGRIKADETLCGIPVIALTASAMRGDRERFLAAGCDDYLSKPIQAMELINMVEAYYPSNGNRP
jgi:CheY-like chemotaxis protein